jgi:hypothetical protein
MDKTILEQDLLEIQPNAEELKAITDIISVGFKAFKNANYPPSYKHFLQAISNVDYYACKAINMVGEQQAQGLIPIKEENAYNWVTYKQSYHKAYGFLKQIDTVLSAIEV